ncbi:hypothetical protein GCM10009801_56060 [Streptomyces albiaxialis]|uniref:Uncharacterized protein n=1 Tax=Streptomyces albiaxialis TaxID=329523 RepID=A0ABP5I1G5_9ACTN
MSTSQDPRARQDHTPAPCPFARSAAGAQGSVLLEAGFDCPRLRAPDAAVHAYADRVPAGAGARGGAAHCLVEDEVPGAGAVFSLEEAGVAECEPGTGGCRG